MKKITKKITILLISFLAILSIANAASDLQIVVDEITPLPVEPGEDMTIKVRVENIGDESAEDIEIERIYDFPFRLEYDLQEQVQIGNLGSGSSRELTFYVSVSPKAKTGVYPLTLKIKEGISIKEQDILINIVGIPDIIFNVNNIDNNIVADSSFKVNLNLQNIGTGNARKIKISSKMDGFAFKDSSIEYIDNLAASENKNTSLEFLVDENKNAGLYQIPFTIEMIGENGQTYISTQNLNLNIIDNADVTLKDLKIKPAGATVGKPITIEVRVENIGVGSADNVFVELKFNEGTTITGSKKAYIGHLDKTDESPAFFTLNSKTSGKYPAEILIHYTDDLGEHTTKGSMNISYKEDTSLNYTLYGSILVGIILLFVIIGKLKK